ncbi:PREDICTED: uncharacterized protein C9orf43 homolog isoform X2 [Chinchilla lanigera]|uniref:uncharacterized protein C9orf43 homolog isoform X2 n=1 Tax=Chinchilla lanigera TaxID=34839 RepID=UPI000695FBFD|nr:PREDICTED: uncharacterized protein C9orf43 homolog isoform X2 [Chinchilla lanigera]
MVLPDDSQWDETTCDLAVCPHPQCWAAVRRIERGHPRILSSPCKTPLDAEDKLPGLAIVNISDSCFQAKRLAHQQSPELAFTKARSLLSRGSKLASKFPGRAQKNLPEKSFINYRKRSPKESHKKLSVLNLNETQLPCPEDVRNMVVIWIPEESEKNVCLPEKTSSPSQYGKKKRKVLAGKMESSLGPPERRQFTETGSRIPEGVVLPFSPVVRTPERLSSAIPVWAHDNMLPQDLLKELLLHGEKNMPCPEMKTQLDRMKKSLPLEKNRPDSAISSKMFLTVQRLTLQRPALRYPEYLKKREGHRKQSQEGKEKTPTKEAEMKSKSDQRIQSTPHKHSAAIACSPLCGHGTLSGQESDTKQQQQQIRIEGAILKQVSIERSRKDHSDTSLSFLPDMRSSKMSMMELPCEVVETVLEAPNANQEKNPQKLSESVAKTNWKPDLKLLRILQAADVEEENQPSGTESEDSLDT